MKDINFIVNGMALLKVKSEKIAKGSKRYLRCCFDMQGHDWEGCRTIASFTDVTGKEIEAVMLEDNSCMVPDSVTDLDMFKVKLIGVSGKIQFVTNSVIVTQWR